MRHRKKVRQETRGNFVKLKALTEVLNALDEERDSVLVRLEQHIYIRDKVLVVLGAMPVDDMYDAALQVALEATGSKYGSFGYIDSNGDLICPSLSKGFGEECAVLDKSFVFPKTALCKMPSWGYVYTKSEFFLSNNAAEVPVGHVPIDRIMIAPIVYHGTLIGVIAVANKPVDYGNGDEKILSAIARQLAPFLSTRPELGERLRGDGNSGGKQF